MTRISVAALVAAGVLGASALPAFADSFFNRISSFEVALNAPDAEVSSSEIITATDDGMMLIYSDSPAGGIGFVDISDAKAPRSAGFLDMEGEPTSVTVIGGKAYVGVNTSESYTNPSGVLAVVDIASKSVDARCELGGQPDSVAKSKDGGMVAVAIENERDEELNDGVIPQAPAGFVALFSDTNGRFSCDSMRRVDLAGLAEIAGDDPEPEFADFNEMGEIVVSMQENNHIAIIDAASGMVKSHFSAGAVDLEGIDTKDNGSLDFTGSLSGVKREPDAVKWLDNDRFVTANEGDYEGGSRSFSIFHKDGTLIYDSGNALDRMAARLGHYPDKRSDAKGVEPEGLEVARFGDDTYIFVLEERSSLVAIYKDTGAEPEYLQSVPSGIAPEGAVAIPSRNLLATANEADLREDGLSGSHVMVYELAEGEAAYPTIMSGDDADGNPIGFVALSGLAADPDEAGKLYAVSDSFLGFQPSIYVIDATQKPAMITDRMVVSRNGMPAQKIDLEGIVADGKGGFWLASEGNTATLTPHALINVNAKGEIKKEVGFPNELMGAEIRFGMEGVTAIGSGDEMTLWVAIQREWRDDEKGMVKLVSYTPASGEWGAVHYPLDKGEKGWVGLSDITVHGEHAYIVERDNQIAEAARIKKLYRVPVSELQGAALDADGPLPVVSKEEVRDFMADLSAFNGYVVDKVEGFTIDAAGEGFVATDNDGVDDSSGETFFWSIGTM